MKPCDLVLLGAQGDLARRKLLPALYQLDRAGLVAAETTVVGVGLGELSDEGFVAATRESLATYMKEALDAAVWERFARRLRFATVDLTKPEQYRRLGEEWTRLGARR